MAKTSLAAGRIAELERRVEFERRERERAESSADTYRRLLVAKIEENTTISKEAFAVANHVNEKIATVAERAARGEAAAATAQRADQHAVASMDGVMREMAELRAMTNETHRLLNERGPVATSVIVAVDAPKPDA